MLPQSDLSTWRVALDWRIEFGLWLRNTPNQHNQERSRLTLDAYERDINLMADWFEHLNGTAFQPSDLNSMDLKSYFKLLESEAAPATYNRKLASVRLFIKWARLAGLIDYDPAEWIPFANAVRHSPRDLVAADRQRLEAAAVAEEGTLLGLRDSLIHALMDGAGLRISETISLRIDDLHLDEGYIHVLGKGRKHRNPRIGSKLVEKIRSWLDRMPASIEGTLITDERGLSIGREQAWKRFVLIAESACSDATPHQLRHTYVLRYMDAVMAGDPSRLPIAIDAACQQTGDRPEVILAYYTRARESDMRAAAEMM